MSRRFVRRRPAFYFCTRGFSSAVDGTMVDGEAVAMDSVRLDADAVAYCSANLDWARLRALTDMVGGAGDDGSGGGGRNNGGGNHHGGGGHGRVLVSGVGKSGAVAQRLAASLTSTGTPAHFVHAAEWAHGDLGSARPGDVALFFSHSGGTAECVGAARALAARGGVAVAAIVGDGAGGDASALGAASDVCVAYPLDAGRFAEPLGLVPTSSVVLQEVVANALVSALVARRGFGREAFARNHPGGAIGKALRGD